MEALSVLSNRRPTWVAEGGPLTPGASKDPSLLVSVPLSAILELLKAVVIKMPDEVRQELARDLAPDGHRSRNDTGK